MCFFFNLEPINMFRTSRASYLINNLCVLCSSNFYFKEAVGEPSPPLRPGGRKSSNTSLQSGGGEGRRVARKVKHTHKKKVEEEEDAFSQLDLEGSTHEITDPRKYI